MGNNNIAIKIILSKNSENVVKDILYGIEEEGIPYDIIYDNENKLNENNLMEEAYIQAQMSKLSLGVAIYDKKAIFHYSKLKENKPLFVINNLEDIEKIEKRNYGSNIARLIKGIPLKII